MADETNQQKLERVLGGALTLEQIQAQVDAIFPESCVRTVEKEEGTSEECNASTGNPYRYRHCVTITNCDNDNDNMPRTCGQWHCVGAE